MGGAGHEPPEDQCMPCWNCHAQPPGTSSPEFAGWQVVDDELLGVLLLCPSCANTQGVRGGRFGRVLERGWTEGSLPMDWMANE